MGGRGGGGISGFDDVGVGVDVGVSSLETSMEWRRKWGLGLIWKEESCGNFGRDVWDLCCGDGEDWVRWRKEKMGLVIIAEAIFMEDSRFLFVFFFFLSLFSGAGWRKNEGDPWDGGRKACAVL